MVKRGIKLALASTLIAGLASGCSRTYDGSVVPTYEMGTGRLAGIPYLKVRRTPLDQPNLRGIAPLPRNIAESGINVSERAEPALPSLPRRAARRAAPRSVAGQPAQPRDLRCRDAAPGERQVRMVCE